MLSGFVDHIVRGGELWETVCGPEGGEAPSGMAPARLSMNQIPKVEPLLSKAAFVQHEAARGVLT